MKNEKRKFTAEFKVQVLRENLENQVPVSKICEQYNHIVETAIRVSFLFIPLDFVLNVLRFNILIAS